MAAGRVGGAGIHRNGTKEKNRKEKSKQIHRNGTKEKNRKEKSKQTRKFISALKTSPEHNNNKDLNRLRISKTGYNKLYQRYTVEEWKKKKKRA